MAKKAYIGVNNIARKIKKGYVGVDNITRRIKKAYIGIGGVARPCWSGGELAYYGEITPLSIIKYEIEATTVGNYALFGGGNSGSYTYTDTVDAYSKSLTHSTPTALSEARSGLAATTIGNYALFGGGDFSTASAKNCTDIVDAYNTSLTRSTPTALSEARSGLAATTIGNYALFGGGYIAGTNYATTENEPVDTVDAYNTSLTRSTPTALSTPRTVLAATTVGNYALFGGNSSDLTVDAYNTSLTRSTPTALNSESPSAMLSATTVPGYALFFGKLVEAYDSSLTKISVESVDYSNYNWTAIDDYAVMINQSYVVMSGSVSKMISYDKSLTKVETTLASEVASTSAATTVGDFALFSGRKISSGLLSSTTTDKVYAVTIV